MSKVWNIYSKGALPTDAPKYVAENLEYHDNWMGEEYVSVTIVSPKSPNPNTAEPFFLEIGDFIIYRGRTYSIYNVPSAIKQARVQTYGEAFKYENVKFSSRAMELTEIRFLDIVLGDNQLHYTSLPTFSVYCETVDDLVDRLQANADRIKDDYDYWFFITPSKQRTLQRIIKWDETQGEWVPDTERRAVAELLWNEYFSVDADIANEKKNVNIQVDKVSVWDGLSYVKQHFGLNFITNVNSYGRNVIIGASAKHTENTFRYGKNNGLHQIERVADSDQLVVTKLYAYGSDKNLPYHYYNDINIRPYMEVTNDYHISSSAGGVSVLLENTTYNGGAFKNMIHDDGSLRWYTFTCKIGDTICDANAELVLLTGSQTECTVRLIVQAYNSHIPGAKSTTQAKVNAIKAYFDNYAPVSHSTDIRAKVIFLSETDITKFPVNRHTALTDGMPDNMSVNCLMLPGFPVNALNDVVKCEYIEVENEQLVDETRFYVRNTPDDEYSQTPSFIIPGNHVFTFSEDRLRPWIKSPNAAELGIKEGDVHFTEESDDNGLQDVHPSIEGMTEDDVFHNGSTERLDEIFYSDVITDNGIFKETDNKSNFKVKLKNLGFDLRAAYANAGSSMQLCMKDGYCGGRNFNVKGVNSIIDNNGNITGWELNVERLPDESLELYFPYSDKAAHGQTPIANEPYQIRGEIRDGNNELVYAGDHFVLTDILIQDTNYIHAASVELFRKSCIWLAANDYTRFTYLPKIDEIFMARDKDTAYRAEYDTIKAGNLMKFEDEDLQINGSVYIDQLTIKEGGNKDIPTFDVTLREDKQVGSLQRMQNQINSLTFAAGDSGGAALRYLKSIWDFDANGNLFTKYNVYSLLGISALGYSKGGSGGGGATSLDDLVDVEIASPTDGQVLKYNAQTHKWINGNDEGVTSVLWSNILNKPTTIGGYGITDAYISNGVIHLGGVEITPLTSFTETDPTVPQWAKASTKPSYAFSEITGTATSSQIPSLDAAKVTTGIFSVSLIPDITISKITDFPSKWAWSDIDNKPTTLSGYGITDVTIADGVITLGTGNTITPVTSVAMTVPTGFVVTGSPITKTGTLALAYSAGYEGFTTTLKNKIDLLYSLFTREGSGTSADPYIIKANYGLYTEQFLSALGLNSQQGSSGALEDLVDVNISNPQNNEVLKYDSQSGKWVNGTDQGVTSLAWSQITGKPTTVSGYGITDAYINAGTIYIGGASITPLTSFTETDPTVPAWAKAASKPSYVFSEITGTASASQIPSLDASKITSGTFDSTRIPTASSSVKGGVIVGTGLVIASAVLGLATSGVTQGTYTKLTVDAYGRATYGTTLETSDIPDLSGTYLPLTGGTLTGALALSGRLQGDGDDEGLVIGFASNGFAGVCLGSPTGVRSVFYYHSSIVPFWRYYDGTNNYDLRHPASSGIIATQTWVGNNYLPLSAGSTKPLTGDLYVGSNSVLFANTSGLSSLSTQISSSELTIGKSDSGVVESEEQVTIESDSIVLYSSVTAFDETTTHTTILLPSGITIDGNAVATQSWVNANFYTMAQADAKYMTIAAFENLFRAMQSDGTTPVAHPYSPNSVASIKAMFGLWTEQYLSALGLNSQGGGGGASALSDLTDVQITNVANGQILLHDGTHWINVTPNYATTTQLANYLPLSGGTLSGSLTIGTALGIGTAPTSGYALDADGIIRATGMYIVGDAVATQSWVGNQGYIKLSISDPLADGVVLVYDSGAWVTSSRSNYLSGYATEAWVNNKGYLTSSSLNGYATQTWVSQNYMASNVGTLILDELRIRESNNTTINFGHESTGSYIWSNGGGYYLKFATNGNVGIGTGNPQHKLDVNGAINATNVYQNGYAVRTTNDTKISNGTITIGSNSITPVTSLSGYATQSWVQQQGYLTSSSISDMATKTWVGQQGYLKSLSLGNLTNVSLTSTTNGQVLTYQSSNGTWVNKSITFPVTSVAGYTGAVTVANLATALSLSNYATETWVINQGYITSSGSCAYATSAGSAQILGCNVAQGSTSLADGDVLVYDIGAWYNVARSTYLSGLATTSQLGNYLPLSGGTMTGILNMSSENSISFDIDNNIYAGTYGSNSSRLYITGYNGIRLLISNQEQVTHGYLDITDSGIEINKSVTLNFGATGTLSCDTRGIFIQTGTHWIRATESGCDYDGNTIATQTWVGNNYLPLSGGTMTGDLYLGADIGIILDTDSSIVVDDTDSNLHINGYNAIRFKVNGTEYMTLLQSGNVGIGTTSPSYKLHVNGQAVINQNVGIGTSPAIGYSLDIDGVARASSFVNNSDIRKKSVLKYDIEPPFELVANAPAIRFVWNSRGSLDNRGVCVGSIAQYWKAVIPEAVIEDTEGYLSMQYDVIALLSAISVAKRVTEHERRIEQLERENALLRMEINELKEAA